MNPQKTQSEAESRIQRQAERIVKTISPDQLRPAPVSQIENWLTRGQHAAEALDEVCPLAPDSE